MLKVTKPPGESVKNLLCLRCSAGVHDVPSERAVELSES